MDVRDVEDGPDPETWDAVLGLVVDAGHLVTGEQLPTLVDRHVRPWGLTVELFIVDLPQRLLKCVGHRRRHCAGSAPLFCATRVVGCRMTRLC